MPTLHLVARPEALTACLSVAAEDDAVLLLQDGVYGGMPVMAPERALLALEPDVRARGLTGRLSADVAVVTDAGLVALVETHQPVVTWR